MNKKYLVRLSAAERQACGEVVRTLKGGSQKSHRAQILLKADADGPARTDERISEAIGCRVQTVECVRKRFVTEGFPLALEGEKRQTPPTLPKLDGAAEAQVIALRLGKPPVGPACRAVWEPRGNGSMTGPWSLGRVQKTRGSCAVG